MNNKTFGIGIIGCGLVGKRRSISLGDRGNIIACADINNNRAKLLAEETNSKAFLDWRELLKLPEIEIVIISTSHEFLTQITIEAIDSGKHILVEKPAARFSKELETVIEASKKSNVKIHVGFNHRYHRSLIKAKKIIESGELGELMFIRGRYGHGGRLGYEKEWRAKPEISGGGELIDQGPHMIDLCRWFLGEFSEIHGHAQTLFWDMPVDDNAFMLLKTPNKQTAFLHVSSTEWKNMFSLEIYGKTGKLDLFGLGGSYGVEKITFYKMLPEMGPPETSSWEYPMLDNSWEVEITEFYDDILLDRLPAAGLSDAKAVLKVVEKIYQQSGYDYSS